METTTPVDMVRLCKSVYAVLICIGLAAVIGRILAVDSVDTSRVVDAKFEKELAGKRRELQSQGLSGIRLD